MMFTYSLSQCRDYTLCRLDGPGVINKRGPRHWHLHQHEGGEWTFKSRGECLKKLVIEITSNYDRLYDAQGKYRG